MKKVFIAFVLILFGMNLFAQEEASIWYFGKYAGMSFDLDSGVPSELFDSKMYTTEGCAVLSDSLGNLLFYTDGMTVWNREHAEMPNGTGLFGHWSSAHSALILKKPGSVHEYFIVTSDEAGYIDMPNRGINYSLVDMRLDGGRGDVTEKNVEIFEPATEQIAATMHSNGKDIWIITHEAESNKFRAYFLTENGISKTPVISAIDPTYASDKRTTIIKISPDGRKVFANSNVSSDWENYTHPKWLIDFDNETGLLYNPLHIENYDMFYVEFSPNGKYLYALHRGAPYGNICFSQFNADAASSDEFINSAIQISNKTGELQSYKAMQLAPNGKLYISNDQEHYLSSVERPNEQGLACEYKKFGFVLDSNTCEYGLPCFLSNYLYKPDISSNAPVCEGDTLIIECEGGKGFKYLWTGPDGSEYHDQKIIIPEAKESAEGYYELELTASWGMTYHLKKYIGIIPLPDVRIEPGGVVYVCYDSLRLTADPFWAKHEYEWSDGSDGEEMTVRTSGTYSLSVRNEHGCVSHDTVTVFFIDSIEVKIEGGNEVCEGQKNFLKAMPDNSGYSYLWSTGENTPGIEIFVKGEYWVEVSNPYGCEGYDTIEVTFHPKPQISIDGETDICEGQTTELIAECQIADCSFTWSTGVIRESIVVGASGTYTVIAESAFGCRDTASVTVEVHPLPQVRIVGDTVFCYGESIVLKAEPVVDTLQYEWSDGSAGPEITISVPGEYYVTVTDEHGCSGSDKIEVRYYEIVLDGVRDISFDSVIAGNSADEPLSFTNRGDEITIESISLKDATAFSVVSSPGTPVSLGKDENIDLTVTFAPPAAGAFTDTLLVRIPAPCDTTIRIALSGTGIQPEFHALIRLPDTVATIGDPAYKIPLHARMLSDTTLNLSYTAEISFDATLMLPEDGFTQRTEGGRRYVNLSGGPFDLGTEERQIGEVTGSIFLPQCDICGLRIESFAFDKEYVRDSLINGSIQVEGICEPGLSQIKLMQPEFSVYPNPAEGEITIEIELEKAGALDISIINTLGQTVYKVSSDAHAGKYTKAIGTDALPAGMYFIRARSGGKKISAAIIVK